MNDQTTLLQDILLSVIIIGFIAAFVYSCLNDSFAVVGIYTIALLLSAAIGTSNTNK
jgi:uncharacterized membrane protein (Fun14 family)